MKWACPHCGANLLTTGHAQDDDSEPEYDCTQCGRQWFRDGKPATWDTQRLHGAKP